MTVLFGTMYYREASMTLLLSGAVMVEEVSVGVSPFSHSFDI